MKNRRASNRLFNAFRLALLAVLVFSASALAIQPGRWTHSTEADFSAGLPASGSAAGASGGSAGEGAAAIKDVVITNQGEIKLSAHRKLLADLAQQGAIVNDIQALDNNDIYLAIGPETQLLRFRDGKIQTVLSLPNRQLFSLDRTAEGKLLLGISGDQSQLAILESDQLRPVVDLPSTRYIWDMLVTEQGVVLATGVEGRLLAVDLKAVQPMPVDRTPATATPATAPAAKPDAKAEIRWPAGVRLLLDTNQANLLCLGRDAKNRLYVGTDTDGLVYRVEWPEQPSAAAKSFVILDAQEPEVATLLVQADGTVFAGTADAEQARPGRLSDTATAKTGRPVPGAASVPAQPADLPGVPPKPQPKPETQTPTTAPAGLLKPAPEAKGQTPSEGALAEAAPKSVPLDLEDAHRQIAQRRAQTEVGPSELAPLPTRTTRPATRSAGPSGMRSGGIPSGPGGSAKQGNAIYRIDSKGFVTEIFRESVMVLKIIADPADAQRLLVSTGNQGQLYRIDPAADETVILATVESQQIPAMHVHRDQVILGVANPAQLLALERQFAKSGSYTSTILDAGHISQWGIAHLTAQVPAQTSVTLQTRSGNVRDPQAAAWSPWTQAQPHSVKTIDSPLTPRSMRIDSPPARFLQYRLNFVGDGSASAIVQRIELNYVAPNLKPVVTAVKIGSAASSGSPMPSGPGSSGPRMPAMRNPAQAQGELPDPPATVNVSWEASDPNQDRMRYSLDYQSEGSDKWINLAEDLDNPTFEWQIRRVPDGRYLLRVTASDSPDNPPDMAKSSSRLSDPVLVNNTPPDIRQVKVQAGADKGSFTVTATVASALSTIQRVDYALDSNKNWTPVLPDDLIFDSTSETVTVKIVGLKIGPHVLTLRAVDSQGNMRYHALPLDVR